MNQMKSEMMKQIKRSGKDHERWEIFGAGKVEARLASGFLFSFPRHV